MDRAPPIIGRSRFTDPDPRVWQIAVLTALLTWNIGALDLGASLNPSVAALAGAIAAQAGFSILAGQRIELRSALITGLSLSLLLRTDALWLQAAAGVLAIASKFLLRIHGKPVFNPAAAAILVLLASGHGWVSPGQWGQSAILASAMVLLGIMVLHRASRLDIALCFGGLYAALLLVRAVRLGDPWAIPLHQLQSGALVLFGCFMITDPRSTPNGRIARLIHGGAVAALAHWLIFVEQIPFGLYLSLILVAGLVPVLDRLMPAERFPGPRLSETIAS